MKKVITLILVTFMATMLLPNCSSSSEAAELQQEQQNISEVDELWQEVIELRKEVDNLHSELSQLKEQISQSTTKNAELSEVSAETPKNENSGITPELLRAPTATKDMLDFLTIQLESNDYEEWNAVANCGYATEEHLLKAAKQCAEITNSCAYGAVIARSICENPATTGAVIKELANSPCYNIWNIAAKSTHADEESLIVIAKQCAEITNSRAYATEIARSICENPAVTSRVLKELANSSYNSVTTTAREKLEELQ